MLVSALSDINFTLGELPTLQRPDRVLMTTPDFFEVAYEINPHMLGNVGSVDREVAHSQWNVICRTYESLGCDVAVVPGAPGLPDMVFCANQSLPYLATDGARGVVLSRMHAPQRQGEVRHFEKFFASRHYEISHLPESVSRFEGMGDALWHVGRRLLWGGHGFRSDASAFAHLASELRTHVVMLELVDPYFYHLDTCLCILDENTALIYPDAFTDEGVDIINRVFDRVIVAPEPEARGRFAVNAHSPDGRHVLIQSGSSTTEAALRSAGFVVLPVDTSEYVRAGGSVFCMKQMFW